MPTQDRTRVYRANLYDQENQYWAMLNFLKDALNFYVEKATEDIYRFNLKNNFLEVRNLLEEIEDKLDSDTNKKEAYEDLYNAFQKLSSIRAFLYSALEDGSDHQELRIVFSSRE